MFADMCPPVPLMLMGGGTVCGGIALAIAAILGGLQMIRRSKAKPGVSSTPKD